MPSGAALRRFPQVWRYVSRCRDCPSYPPVVFQYGCLHSAATGYGVVDPQHGNGTNHCNHHAPGVESGHARYAKRTEYEPPNDRTQDAEYDVKPEPLAFRVDELAPDEAGYQTKHDPTEDRHK